MAAWRCILRKALWPNAFPVAGSNLGSQASRSISASAVDLYDHFRVHDSYDVVGYIQGLVSSPAGFCLLRSPENVEKGVAHLKSHTRCGAPHPLMILIFNSSLRGG